MASSLLWQAAAWGDEWVDYATAVTVTDGYLCAGEIFGDGTGTDIKCDSSNPYIADDGNVGIGTASPSVALDISGTLKLANGAELCAGGTAGAMRYSTVSNTIEYCNSSAWTSLGPSDTTPIAFYALRNAGHVSSGNIIIFNVEKLDTGEAFNTSTGEFTAPYNGVYQFSWGGIGFTTHDVYRIELFKNGSDAGLTEVRLDTRSTGGDYAEGSNVIYMSLTAGDTVSVYFSADNGSDLYASATGNGPYFAGHMVVPSSMGGEGGPIDLDDLTDVNAGSPSEGEVLSWNDSSGRWEPSATASAIDALGDIGDVSDTAAGDGQVLAWDNANSEWAPKNAQEASVFSCPAGFTLIQNAGQTLGCMQTDEEGSGDWPTAVDACFDNYGGRLPTTTEWYVAMANYTLTNETGNWETASDAEYNSVENHAIVGNASISDFFRGSDTFERPYRCFIPATGQISITTVAALSDVSASAPTDGQVLAWDDGNSEWVASDASAGASALVSLTDVSPTAATEGQVLSYNDTTNSWEPSDTSVINNLDDIGDVSVSTPADNNLLRYNTSTSKWEAVGINDGLSTTTMVPEWPDAIQCEKGADVRLLYYAHSHTSGSITKYRNLNNTTGDYYVQYNTSDGTYFGSTSGMVAFDCVTSSWSISELYSEGRAFNFLGNNGAQTNLTELIDVSASAPNDGDTLTWNSSSEKWVPGSSNGGGTPSGAVMAFNLASCPSGWSEYTLARGRFIRGIDSTGTNDPDGVRALGSTQTDDFKSHRHSYSAPPSNNYKAQSGGFTNTVTANSIGSNSGYSGGDETRPINVALLYCEKD